jgi:SAM-dependent MidA family methyltransferase
VTIPSPLACLLADRIRSTGPISFATFMAEALYHPSEGYYRASKQRTGRSGDFYTSVSVGPLFGRLLARQFVEIWSRIGCPSSFTLVEQGANDGTLLRDVLEALRAFAPDCFAQTHCFLVEPFPELESRQRNTLAQFPHINWVADSQHLPAFHGIHFSNELLDAFPFHRVFWNGAQWEELAVHCDHSGFSWIQVPITRPELEAAVQRLPVGLPSGYTTEVRTSLAPWIESLAPRLKTGAVMVVDYGYPRSEFYRPERSSGTATAYLAHQQHADLLSNPGTVDLTAHVDFTTLVEAAIPFGLSLHGFCDQSRFLAGLGPLHFEDSPAPGPETEKELRAFKTLFHPGIMGSSFKALCLAKLPDSKPLSGFRFAPNPWTALEIAP